MEQARAAEMHGYSEEEALRLNAANLIPGKAREDMLQHGEKAPPRESWHRAMDGRAFKVWPTTSVLLDESG
ncbi:MAG: hypothetical protein EPN14_07105, partial [Gallionella sp.]